MEEKYLRDQFRGMGHIFPQLLIVKNPKRNFREWMITYVMHHIGPNGQVCKCSQDVVNMELCFN